MDEPAGSTFLGEGIEMGVRVARSVSTKELDKLAVQANELYKSAKRQQELARQLAEAASLEPPNFSVIRRLLSSSVRQELEGSFPEASGTLEQLQAQTDEAWDDLELYAIGDFMAMAEEAGHRVQGQSPNLTLGRGIGIEFRIHQNRTVINGTQIQSIDPRDVLEKATSEHERLWAAPFDPDDFVRSLYTHYSQEAGNGDEGVPVLRLYDRMRGDLKKTEATRFTKDVFAAQLSRALEAEVRAPDGALLQLRPTATPQDALPIFDVTTGEWAYRGRVLFKVG